MSFLTKNNFITKTNNPAGTNATWVMQSLVISVNGETINDANKVMEGNNVKCDTWKTTKYSMAWRAITSPWCLIHVIAVANNGNHEDHILSCCKRNETCCYYQSTT